MNKDNYLKNYATEGRNKPSIIDQIEAYSVSVLNKYGLGYRGGAGGEKKRAQSALRESIITFILLLKNWGVLSRDIVRQFCTPILKGIKGSTRTKNNQSAKYNLNVEKLQREVAIARKKGSAWTSRYYYLINGKSIGEELLLKMENVMSIIMDHIKYLDAQQLSNTKKASERSPTWSNLQMSISDKIYAVTIIRTVGFAAANVL